MRPLAPFALSLALVPALVLAGCFSQPGSPAERQFSASGGSVSEGYAYDGAGLAPASATLSGTLNNPDNRGAVNVSFDFLGAKYVVSFDRFAEAQPIHEGGVRFDFDEHGDTQNGDALLPKMHVKAAAWGTASVTKNGAPLVGAAGDRWVAHLMLSDDTVRGADGRITNAAGTAPYNPSAPTDAKVATGDPQAILFIKSPDGETAKRAPLNESKTLTCTGPNCAGLTAEIPTELGAESLTVNITFTPTGPAPIGAGQATATLKDAGGNETKTQQLNIVPNQPALVTWTLAAAEITGPFTVEIAGAGAWDAKVDYAIAFDDHPFLVVTWNDVTVTP